MSKTPRSMVTVTLIEESEKFRPWAKRFFIFMVNQGVQCRKTEMIRWSKAVMSQKQRSEKNKKAVATCSFVISGTRELPKVQGIVEKALSSVVATIKKYGAVLWFIIIKDKVYVVFNIFTLKQAARLLKDVESRQAQSDVVKSLGSDLYRANARFKGNDLQGATFCPSDLLEIRTLVESEVSQQPPIEQDEKVNSQPEEAYAGKIAPFTKFQTVEVYSKTSGQWVTANVECVQEDSEGIFVTVKRIDGHELDYDIDNVRAIRGGSMQREHNMPMVLKNDTSDQMIPDNQHESLQRDDYETSNKQGRQYTERVLPPDHMADALAQPYQAQSPPIPSNSFISDAEWFKRMETYHIFDKIRSVKTWLRGMLEESEPLPQMITEELKEVSEMLQKYNYG